MSNHHTKPGSPGEVLAHYGKKGMKWGVVNEDKPADDKPLTPGTPEFQAMIGRVTRTDHPQFIKPPTTEGGKVQARGPEAEKHGLTGKQKVLLTFGAATAAAAGYYAYQHYSGNTLPNLDPAKISQDEHILAGMKLPASWDVSGLKHNPISTQPLGKLAGGEWNLKLLNEENLVVNTARGYADIVPKDGFATPFAAHQHASVTKILEQMREKYPAVRNMNIEVIPMSHVPGVEGSSAFMSVLSMRAGEARVMYNDQIDFPDAATIKANARFLPGLAKPDYIANHEMGHLLAVAHGELPPAFNIAAGNATPAAAQRWMKAEPLLHKKMFQKHGFTFEELSKLSGYAATEPAEAMAELAGHYFTPEMRSRLTPSQLKRAEAMFNEMGGLSG